MSATPDRSPAILRGLLVVFMIACAALGLSFGWRYLDPPVALPADAAPELFSATRARALLERLAGSGEPRPLASASARATRERLLEELRSLGYEPELQQTRASQSGRIAAPLVNVLARLEGHDPARTILLVAHYDSVAAGPGIGDDLSGCAVLLELAAVVRTWGEPRANIAFLFNEGEELGLLGAAAFAAEHPWMATVELVVNLEARGTSGPSYLFETGPNPGPLLASFSKHVARPATNSLSREIYRRLPNDTDLTVFLERERSGANFAFIEGVEHYHTPLDNLDMLDADSVQHHGDNVSALLRGLWQAEREPPSQSEAVWFDVLGRLLIVLDLRLVRLLALLSLIAAVVAALRARALRHLQTAGILGAALGPLALTLASGALAFVSMSALRQLTQAERLFWAQPTAGWLILGGSLLLAQALFARSFAENARGGLGAWLAWSVAAAASAGYAPGASFLALVPALLLAVFGPICALHRAGAHLRQAFALLIVLLLSLTVWVSVLRGLTAAFGLARLEFLTLACAAPATLLAPSIAAAPPALRRVLGVLGLGALLTGAFLTVFSPLHTSAAPAPLNFAYALDSKTGEAYWIARPHGVPLPENVALAAAMPPQLVHLQEPWRAFGAKACVASAPLLTRLPPSFEELERRDVGEHIWLRARVRSPGNAAQSLLFLATAVEDAEEAGIARAELPDKPKLGRAPTPAVSIRRVALCNEPIAAFAGELLVLTDLSITGAEIELLLPRAGASRLYVLDRFAGLPPEGDHLLRSRDAAGCVPIGQGDATYVLTQVDFPASQ